jgi:hypothetical protein
LDVVTPDVMPDVMPDVILDAETDVTAEDLIPTGSSTVREPSMSAAGGRRFLLFLGMRASMAAAAAQAAAAISSWLLFLCWPPFLRPRVLSSGGEMLKSPNPALEDSQE